MILDIKELYGLVDYITLGSVEEPADLLPIAERLEYIAKRMRDCAHNRLEENTDKIPDGRDMRTFEAIIKEFGLIFSKIDESNHVECGNE